MPRAGTASGRRGSWTRRRAADLAVLAEHYRPYTTKEAAQFWATQRWLYMAMRPLACAGHRPPTSPEPHPVGRAWGEVIRRPARPASAGVDLREIRMLDLTEMFGEGWCVTLAPMGAMQALERMGVLKADLVRDGMERASERLAAGSEGPEVMVLARELRGGWCMVVELEGTSGWVGMDHGVLAALSADGRVVVSAFQDPNQIMVQVAADGTVVCELDVIGGYFTRGESNEGRWAESLLSAGFSRDDDPVGRAAQMDFAERAVLALAAVTGVELVDADFDGPWLAGLISPAR